MAKREVVWTRTADLQFIGVLEYWINRNKSNAYSKKLAQSVAKRTKHIAQSPFSCKSTNVDDVRVASMGNFSLFYKVTENQIIVTAFWDNRQNPKNLLDILKNKNR